jgi:pilus assembly protein CpaE
VDVNAQAGLPGSLDAALDRLVANGAVAWHRGRTVAVVAPMPGSGGTTVAVNLAGALAVAASEQVGLLEVSRGPGDVGALLGVGGEFDIDLVCSRWESLDTASLSRSFIEYRPRMSVLPAALELRQTQHASPAAIRRLAVLCRALFTTTVTAVEPAIDAQSLEALLFAETIVLVTRPDVPAVRRTKEWMSVVSDAGIPPERFQLVVNRWGQRRQLPLAQIETTLGLKSSVLIPDDPKTVNQAANLGCLLRDVSRWASVTRRHAVLAARLGSKPTMPPYAWWS